MKLFTCTNFTGFWPVGTAAVILAKDKEQAEELLMKNLVNSGLGNKNKIEDLELIQVSQAKPIAVILNDGGY